MGRNGYEQCVNGSDSLPDREEFDDIFEPLSDGKEPPEDEGSGTGKDDGDDLK